MRIQYTGYIKILNEKIKVLVRETNNTRSLKIRKSGLDGNFLSDESIFLGELENKYLLDKLINGCVIKL